MSTVHDVFISYSTEDKAVAEAVCTALESRRIKCWIAPRDVNPGVPYAEDIINGLQQSRLMVLVLSADSNQSQHVLREVGMAVSKGIPVITLRIADVPLSKAMEYYLSAHQWLDAFPPPLEPHLQKLADTVLALTGKVKKPPVRKRTSSTSKPGPAPSTQISGSPKMAAVETKHPAPALLLTKLFIPPARPGLVARPRLMERMKDVLNCGLTLVSAPAGFGKSTLLGEWARQSKEQCRTAWVSLDEGDNDPVRFWDYFIAAMRTLQPSAGENALTLLHTTPPCPTETVLTALINDLADIADNFAIILDDYHLIKAEAIHSSVAFLLEHLPPNVHLVIATRADPPLALPHFRGRGTLLEVGADDLRFNDEEAIALSKASQTTSLTAEEVSALNEHTEGWIVGLKMALLSLGQYKDVKGFIDSFTGSERYIMDYLVEEVLKRQPEEINIFLLKTSLLERLSGPLCDFVAERTGSTELLTRLEDSNLFLVPLDAMRQWYRYHHLFAELLRHQSETNYAAKEVADLHQRASQWYEDNKFPDDAIHHALIASDWERAMRLIYDSGQERIKIGETVRLLNWLKAVPDEVLRTHHQLYRQFAQLLTNAGDFERAESVLGYLEQTAQDDNNLQGEIAVLRAGVAQNRGDYLRAIDLSKRALSLLRPDNFDARARASMTAGSAYFETSLFDEAYSLTTDAYEMGQKATNHSIVTTALALLGVASWQQGKLHRAVEQYRQAVSLAEQSPASVSPRITLSYTLYELNHTEEAMHQLQQAIELSRLSGSIAGTALSFLDGRAVAHYHLANSLRARGDVAGAMAVSQKSDELAQTRVASRAVRGRHASFRVLFSIWQDDRAATEYWRTQVLEFADALPFWLRFVPLRVMIADGEKKAAAGQLKVLREQAAKAKLNTILIRAIICQALAAERPAEALTFLSEALKLGQPEGFIRSFVDEGRLLAPLLRQASTREIVPEYAAKLLNIFELEERLRQTGGGEIAPASPAVGLLSERELEILKLVAAGLSNRQIAERLIVTLGTIKVHVHNLMEKLNARSRTQAVIRAQELKLI